jgi:hypothetical protein
MKKQILIVVLAAIALMAAGCAAVSGPGVTGLTADVNGSIHAVGQYRLQQQTVAMHQELVRSCVDGNANACMFMGNFGVMNPAGAYYYNGLIPYTGPGNTFQQPTGYYPQQMQQLPQQYHSKLEQLVQAANRKGDDAIGMVKRILRKMAADEQKGGR